MAKHMSAPAGQPVSPVDDRTYNLLQALTSTLEALDAYEVYAEDDPNGVFVELMEDERNHAERLLRELRDCLHPAADH
jgi:rubrerythrin